MTTFNYILRDTGRLLMRHWFLGILTLVTAAVMILILGFTSLFSMNIQKLLQKLESELRVQAYIHKTADAPRVADTIRGIGTVTSVKVFSPEDSLKKLQLQMGKQSDAFDLLDENPLPWNFEIHVLKASDVAPLVRTLMAMPEVEDVIYSGMVVERVTAISSVASKLAIAMFFLSIMITSLVVYNTIHISLYSRREEINIMFLVGATKSYISAPFVLEGTFLALLGSLIAVLGIATFYLPGIRLLQNSLSFLDLIEDNRTIAQFCLMLVAFAATLGWVCSYIVVTRFMRAATKPL